MLAHFTFYLLAFLALLGAIGVVTLRQPVHAALSLVATLLTLAIFYVTLSAHFLAAVQVIVYAGAIMVLFLFVIMLLNAQGDTEMGRFSWVKLVAYVVGGLLAVAAIAGLLEGTDALPDYATLQEALKGGGADTIGATLFNNFAFAFQLVGVLLLTGIISAVSLVQRRVGLRAERRGRGAVLPSEGAQKVPGPGAALRVERKA